MEQRGLRKWFRRLPIKRSYNLMFILLLVVPILGVLLVALFGLHARFRQQAIDNILQTQQTVIAELDADIDHMSMRMSSIVFANDNEILSWASQTITEDYGSKYAWVQKLKGMENLYLEPERNIISLTFYFKNGTSQYFKNSINRDREEIASTLWYQQALMDQDQVYVGSYDTEAINDLWPGGGANMLVLVYALSPGRTTDRYDNVEMVELYQTTDVSRSIVANNKAYLNGDSGVGFMQIRDESGAIIYTTLEENQYWDEGYLCIRTPFALQAQTWYLETYIRPGQLTEDFWQISMILMGVAGAILIFGAYFSRFFLHNVVAPVEEVNRGLLEVEEGNLEVHISARGQAEIRSMVHQFNAMVRRLRLLVQEYEDKMQKSKALQANDFELAMEAYRHKVLLGEEETLFFGERYVLIGLFIWFQDEKRMDLSLIQEMLTGFLHNGRYASRCRPYVWDLHRILLYYRLSEQDYIYSVGQMLKELQQMTKDAGWGLMFGVVSRPAEGYASFSHTCEEVEQGLYLHHIYERETLLFLEKVNVAPSVYVEEGEKYSALAKYVFTADEKNSQMAREKVFDLWKLRSLEWQKEQTLALLVALGRRFADGNISLSGIFGMQYDYQAKISRITDGKALRMWVTNYLSWIMEYMAGRLDVQETDVIIKAKRYMADHYEDRDLSLKAVAEYVGLNEKYFTNRFSKEAGETFSSYLTQLRLQKAAEMLKNTTLKIYEIAENTGYGNVEHFNRVFKKMYGKSPTAYRMAGDNRKNHENI